MGQTEMIVIGKIVSAVGLQGEVKVYPYSDNMERFGRGAEVMIGGALRRIESSRFVKRMPVVRIEGIVGRDAAEAMRGTELCVDEAGLPPLPDGDYYVRDLIGCSVVGEGGDEIGRIRDVIQNRAQDLYEIECSDGTTFLLPAVAEFILGVDIAGKAVVARLPEGLLELRR
jgi:16S rRNA processing protein RimM